MSATSATQSASPFVPEGIWLSGKPGFDSFVSREDAYGCAPAGGSPRRSGRVPPRRFNRPATPVPGPFNPLAPCAPSLEAAYRVRSRLRKPTRLGGSGAIQNNAYSQDFVGLQSLLALPSPQDRYSAKPKDSIPTMGSRCHSPAIKVEFPHQDNDVEGSQASTLSQSTASLHIPAQPDAPVIAGDLWEQMPVTLKRSKALRYRPEDLDASKSIDASGPLPNPRLARTRAALSRLRNKLLRSGHKMDGEAML